MKSLQELTILLGGGLDSAVLIPFYQSRNMPIRGVHFDYGQISLPGERMAVTEICKHFAIPLDTIDLQFHLACNQGEYMGRNAILLLSAASMAPSPYSVAIGIHAGVPYYDSSTTFVADIERLFDGYFGGRIGVETPFIKFKKNDIFAFAIEMRVPIEMTFSCERGPTSPCGECPSCTDRGVLLETR